MNTIHRAEGAQLPASLKPFLHGVENAVDYLSVLKNNNYPGSETDDQSRGKDVLGPGHQLLDRPIRIEAGDNGADDSHREEQASDFRHIPFEAGNPHNECHDGQQQNDEDPSLAVGKWFDLRSLSLSKGRWFGRLTNRWFGRLTNRLRTLSLSKGPGIYYHKNHQKQSQKSPAEKPVTHPREKRQIGHPLGDADCERVQESA